MDKATKQLFDAAISGDVDDARAAIHAAADINAKDESGNTPLHCAALLNSTRVIQELLESGADRRTKDAQGFTAEDVMMIQVKALFSTHDRQQGHAGRVTDERKDKGSPQVGG